MRVLVINCGSSTLKFQCLDTVDKHTAARLAQGLITHIGDQTHVAYSAASHTYEATVLLADHAAACQHILAWLASIGITGGAGIDAIGHRVVHGGAHFVEPVLLDAEVIATLDDLSDLAPLHNNPALAAIRAVQSILGAKVPMVAVFDTAFHHTMPARAAHYAIPHELATRYHIRRYGFHGLAHRYMSERYAMLAAPPAATSKLITLQLGSGCSAAAVEDGRSQDTSMGFTPLEGLMMGTRCGDLDPSLPGFLARQQVVSMADIEACLNTRSGLLGVSGCSQDMRELLAAEAQGDTRAALATDMFCYRVRKYIAAYLAVLNGADAVIFGGGIGENAPPIRARICANMDWCGLRLDPARNDAALATEARISADTASLQAYVIPVDEALLIARDTVRCLET